jgi:hypothetical protein
MTAHTQLLTSKVMDTAWRSILETNIPSETHPLQVRVYKRFFMAGAKSLMDTLVYGDTLDEGEDDATPTDVKRLDAIMHELMEFFADVVAERQ